MDHSARIEFHARAFLFLELSFIRRSVICSHPNHPRN